MFYTCALIFDIFEILFFRTHNIVIEFYSKSRHVSLKKKLLCI